MFELSGQSPLGPCTLNLKDLTPRLISLQAEELFISKMPYSLITGRLSILFLSWVYIYEPARVAGK